MSRLIKGLARGPVAVILVAAAGLGIAQNAPDAKQKEQKLEAGEVEAKRLLLLMDHDQSGKVSRDEFMSFMAAEFARLDVNKDGELDVKELTQTRLTPRGGVHR
jgi:hypothetical protein